MTLYFENYGDISLNYYKYISKMFIKGNSVIPIYDNIEKNRRSNVMMMLCEPVINHITNELNKINVDYEYKNSYIDIEYAYYRLDLENLFYNENGVLNKRGNWFASVTNEPRVPVNEDFINFSSLIKKNIMKKGLDYVTYKDEKNVIYIFNSKIE